MDLAHALEREALRRGEDEPHGHFDLGLDGDRGFRLQERAGERVQGLEDRPVHAVDRGQHGARDLSGEERAQRALEGGEGHRLPAARRRAGAEGAGLPLIARELRPGRRHRRVASARVEAGSRVTFASSRTTGYE